VLQRAPYLVKNKCNYFKKTAFQTNEKYRDNSSGTFYKYSNGKICIKDLILIDKIDTDPIYTGSKQILFHPLWLIIENPSAPLAVLLEYMRKLNPDIQNKLFKLNKQTGIL
jgi:hypothetical protein